MMWERCAELVTEFGGSVAMRTYIETVHRNEHGAVAVTVKDASGVATELDAGHVISSMPISSLVRAMDPPAPGNVIAAANGLRYRDFLTVALVVPERFSFPDNWIYIHSPM